MASTVIEEKRVNILAGKEQNRNYLDKLVVYKLAWTDEKNLRVLKELYICYL